MPETWLNLVEAKGHGVTGGEMLTRGEEADEFLLMGLRLAEGIDLARYETLSGRGLSPARLSVLQEEGLVAPVGNSRLRATRVGHDRARRGGGGPGAIAGDRQAGARSVSSSLH